MKAIPLFTRKHRTREKYNLPVRHTGISCIISLISLQFPYHPPGGTMEREETYLSLADRIRSLKEKGRFAEAEEEIT